jgi:hypothetical protein
MEVSVGSLRMRKGDREMGELKQEQVVDPHRALIDAVDAELTHAVVNVLYPRLPEELVRGASAWDPLMVFSALDAIALCVERETRALLLKEVVLNVNVLRLSNGILIGRQWLIREIGAMTEEKALEEETLNNLYDWMLEAARHVPTLFHDMDVTSAENGDITLRMRDTRTGPETDYAVLWAAP